MLVEIIAAICAVVLVALGLDGLAKVFASLVTRDLLRWRALGRRLTQIRFYKRGLQAAVERAQRSWRVFLMSTLSLSLVLIACASALSYISMDSKLVLDPTLREYIISVIYWIWFLLFATVLFPVTIALLFTGKVLLFLKSLMTFSDAFKLAAKRRILLRASTRLVAGLVILFLSLHHADAFKILSGSRSDFRLAMQQVPIAAAYVKVSAPSLSPCPGFQLHEFDFVRMHRDGKADVIVVRFVPGAYPGDWKREEDAPKWGVSCQLSNDAAGPVRILPAVLVGR